MKNDIFEFFQSLKEKYTIDEFSSYLAVSRGTIKRWVEKKEIPSYYYFDLCRMDGIKIDYTKHSEKEKDQIYIGCKFFSSSFSKGFICDFCDGL